MTTELLEPEGVEAALTALDEFRATQNECTDFFGDVFDQLQALSLELFARHKCLELSTEQKQQTAVADDALSACRGEFRRAIEDLQYFSSNLETQLARLVVVVTEIAEARAQPEDESQIAAILESTRQEHAEWVRQRAALEAEVEALRRRAAEQAHALNEQKRLAGQQQAELAGELRRMRSLLEALVSQMRGDESGGKRAPPVDATVLGTVLAQFEVERSAAATLPREKSTEAGNSSRA